MVDKFKKIIRQRFERADQTKAAIPVGFGKPPTLQEQIQRFIHSAHIRAEFDQAGIETFEESEDFDVGDDYDPRSPYEMHFDPELNREVTHGEKQAYEDGKRKFDELYAQSKQNSKFKEEGAPSRKSNPPKKGNKKIQEDDGNDDEE